MKIFVLSLNTKRDNTSLQKVRCGLESLHIMNSDIVMYVLSAKPNSCLTALLNNRTVHGRMTFIEDTSNVLANATARNKYRTAVR